MKTVSTSLRALALGALSVACLSAAAQATALKPAAERISDEAIQADHRAYEGLQARIKGLNDKGRPVRDYHLAKAQCWLDVSFHEYTRNDRGPFPQAALTESEKLIVGMERGATLGHDTPLVGEAVRLRPDLWARAEALRAKAGARCAQHKLACAEVELVHAGNEHAQQQWRHAKPYVQIAEDLLGEAEALATSCAPLVAATVEAVAPPPPPAPPAVPPRRELLLSAYVVFNFDKHSASDMRPFSVSQLEELAARVRREKLDILSVKLSGHADRLNSTGQKDYNQQLSERRVQTVREALQRLGVDGSRVQTQARGDTQPVEACGQKTRSRAELEECLLPNRRVEVLVEALRRE